MNWNQASELLKKSIKSELQLTPDKNLKFVREIPPYKCKNYSNVEGFKRVQLVL